jgi:hypothetical protein
MQDVPTVNEADIQAVAQLLQKLGDGLPPAQQAVLGWIIIRASMADEVAGYSSAPLPPNQIREAVLDCLGFSVPR